MHFFFAPTVFALSCDFWGLVGGKSGALRTHPLLPRPEFPKLVPQPDGPARSWHNHVLMDGEASFSQFISKLLLFIDRSNVHNQINNSVAVAPFVVIL